ncbi:S9 family peptidase [Sphingomonas sp. H39-1-10]|uniref:alpha/beta hydrolase family protein n=1 Tax=Sphingomonas pollutisoli TaxID=3030829 RepID=UPI0023BA0E1E|nr:S9 family peptidase [Sphingomonas pollutisoli]MDF0490845.1 S9 family peptidase [Sphingomonas pollutisoli]
MRGMRARAGTALLAFGAIALSPASAQTSPDPAPLIPLEAFAALPFIEAPQLSPDGTRIAARIAIHGKQRLAIVPLADKSKAVSIDPAEQDLNDWRWVNDQWLLARIGRKQSITSIDYYVTRTISISADGKQIIPLVVDPMGQSGADVLWIAHDGSPHAVIAMQRGLPGELGFWPEVRDFDVSTGRSKMVVHSTETVFNWYADGAGVVRYGIGYTGLDRALRALYRNQPTAGCRVIERAQGVGASLDNRPVLFLPEPDKALAFHDDADGFSTLYPLDLKTMTRGAPLYSVPGYDVDGILIDRERSQMIGVRYTDTYQHISWTDPTLAAIQADFDKAVGNRHAEVVSWSHDRSQLLVKVANASTPGSYYLYAPKEGVLHFYAQINGRFAGKQLASVKTITYKARDGLEIHAVLTLPSGRPAKDLPLILMPHGGPFARDDESWDWWAQFLANRGYAVLQPNYRGSSGYGTKFTDLSKGQWGLAMQDDLTDAVAWATHEGIADAKRVCIVGGSYGGYAALRAAQRDKGVYRCAVSFAGVSDMPGMIRYDNRFLSGKSTEDYFRERAPDLAAVSPANFAADFSIPVLLMHGDDDTTVPVKQSRLMVSRLKAAGKTYRYVEQPGGDHHLSSEADRVQFLKELETFLKQYNPA